MSKKQVIEDINYLHKKLKKLHPNLYTYSTKKEVDNSIIALKTSLPDSLDHRLAYEKIANLSEVIKDGHTIFLPNQDYVKTMHSEHLLVPFDVYWNGESLFVIRNYSIEPSLPEKSEITKINGVPTQNIVRRLLKIWSRDGDNATYPIWKLNNYFTSYFNFVFGEAKTIEIEGNGKTFNVPGSLKKNINEERKKRYPENIKRKVLSQEIDTVLSISTIKITSWYNASIKSNGQNFKKTIKQYFSNIEKLKIQHLVLDFRDNQGGTLRNGKILLSYLLNKKFKIVEKYYRVKNKNASSQSDRLRRSFREYVIPCNCNKRVFGGKLYVLVNGGSFSNSSMVSACLLRKDRATFIGEETGGSKAVLSSDHKKIRLENTGLNVNVPTLQYFLQKSKENVSYGGVKPQYNVTPNLDDLILNKDVEKEFIQNLIKNNLQ